jgi:hypothetical protein
LPNKIIIETNNFKIVLAPSKHAYKNHNAKLEHNSNYFSFYTKNLLLLLYKYFLVVKNVQNVQIHMGKELVPNFSSKPNLDSKNGKFYFQPFFFLLTMYCYAWTKMAINVFGKACNFSNAIMSSLILNLEQTSSMIHL